jgi:hypothetical protein
MEEKIDDYLRFGYPYTWIINPRLRKGYVATKDRIVDAGSGILYDKRSRNPSAHS